MKKIITLFTFFIGIASQAQYINHTRFLIEANAGYSFAFQINSKDKAFDPGKVLSGFIVEGSVFYRLQFNSTSLLGLKSSFVQGDAVNENYLVQNAPIPSEYASLEKKSNMTFVGPVYRYEISNMRGSLTSISALSVGYVMVNSTFNGSNFTETSKIDGLGVGLDLGTSYTLVEPLHLVFKLGLEQIFLNKPKVSAQNANYHIYDDKTDFTRINVSLGLRYKL